MSPTSYRTAPPRGTEEDDDITSTRDRDTVLAHVKRRRTRRQAQRYAGQTAFHANPLLQNLVHTSSDSGLPTFDDVEQAARRIDGVAHRTPVVTSRTVDERTGAHVFFKCENLQRGGAFKFRGAYNALSKLDTAQRARGVVAFSSGNHAQAVALAGQLLDIPRTIVMPSDSPEVKRAATAGYGARIVLYDREQEDREAIGRKLSEEHGLAVIPPYDYADVIAGAGTAARELLTEVGPLDFLLTPCGGGGLTSGTALSADPLGNVQNSTQSENPANYVGWQYRDIRILNADAGDLSQLYSDGTKSRNVIKSRGITWQGYMFDGAFVPVFGWRRDEVSNISASAPKRFSRTGSKVATITSPCRFA